ncbi:hypothetical protein EIN_183850 [Entamoeba invadens IP1]|uniref:hypothetical protein n=1 Tax=Entamoeba invadens IP1 TaxID=370355 RepID=UPI0002C3E732|nr:hypothetical protein EIN_183850 [Entamoeba invadens IP1]ELP94068.1 hypothetical protein EIN_183850 [Entamoeba invadens IP1]|eukprot:XP_004260839.1 hypothetical protein EIN_183850 [Entamoeba invadens IP1]
MSTPTSIDTLVELVEKKIDALKKEQEIIEAQLSEYSDCRRKVLENVNEWGAPKSIKLQTFSTETIPDEEQYTKPVSWILLKRVAQGRDWSYSRKDKVSMLGVVFSVMDTGEITVRWDDGEKTRCVWGKAGKYDVRVVPFFPSLVSYSPEEQKKQSVSWLIGKVVKRREGEWKWNDQDGGAGKTGVVVSSAGVGWIFVQWMSGNINQYRWGAEHFYDVEAVC